MLRQSITVYLLSRFLALFMCYKESVIYNLILKLAARIKDIFEKSLVHWLFTSETSYEKKYRQSVIYAIIDKLVRFLEKWGMAFWTFARKSSENSVCVKVFNVFHDTGYFKFEYICGLLFGFMLVVPHEMWNNLYAVIMAVLLAGLYVLLHFSGRKFAFNIRAVSVSIIAFLVAVAGGVLKTPVLYDGARLALFYISSVIFAVVIWGSVSDEKTLKILVTMLIGGLTVMCLYALYQNHVGVEIDVRLTDISANSGMPGRVYSTFANPNNFAEAIVLIVPFVYTMILCSGKKITKALFSAVLVLCLVALAMSYSRSCYVAFAIATLVFVFIYDWRLILPLGIVAIMCIPILPESVMNRIFTIGSLSDSSNSYRTLVWEGVINLVKNTGISGIGIGPEAFTRLYPKYANMSALTAMHSHMLYLEVLVELGIVGFLGFMGIMYSSLKKGLSVVNRTNKTIRCFIISCISAFAGISFTACAEYIWFYPRVMFLFWIVLGVLLACVRISRKRITE